MALIIDRVRLLDVACDEATKRRIWQRVETGMKHAERRRPVHLLTRTRRRPQR